MKSKRLGTPVTTLPNYFISFTLEVLWANRAFELLNVRSFIKISQQFPAISPTARSDAPGIGFLSILDTDKRIKLGIFRYIKIPHGKKITPH